MIIKPQRNSAVFEPMSARVQPSPGQRHALSCHVTSSRGVTSSRRPRTCRHVLLLSDFHPCSVSHGTGKLNINIIYSKCHRCKVETGLAVVLIYDFRDNFLNFRLWKVLLALLKIYCKLLGRFYQNSDVDNCLRFGYSISNVIQKTICNKT